MSTYTPIVDGWDGKVVTRGGVTHIELRKVLGQPDHYSNCLIVVSLDGYNLAGTGTYAEEDKITKGKWGGSSQGVNVRLSLNQSARMTMHEFSEIDQVVVHAYRWLRDHT